MKNLIKKIFSPYLELRVAYEPSKSLDITLHRCWFGISLRYSRYYDLDEAVKEYKKLNSTYL